MQNYLLKAFIIILPIFSLTSCKLVSYPGYSDNFSERLAQVMEDEKNPEGKERRKMLYIHRNDSCDDIEKFYRKSHEGQIALELATQKKCTTLVQRIKYDKLISKKMQPMEEESRYIEHLFRKRMQELE